MVKAFCGFGLMEKLSDLTRTTTLLRVQQWMDKDDVSGYQNDGITVYGHAWVDVSFTSCPLSMHSPLPRGAYKVRVVPLRVEATYQGPSCAARFLQFLSREHGQRIDKVLFCCGERVSWPRFGSLALGLRHEGGAAAKAVLFLWCESMSHF